MENEKIFDEYEKHFNAGYTLKANYERLTKEQKEVVDHLSMLNTESPDINAFRDGVKEYLFEKNVEPKLNRRDPKLSKSKGRSKEKGRERDRDI